VAFAFVVAKEKGLGMTMAFTLAEENKGVHSGSMKQMPLVKM